jgi:hypothetical protein
MPSTRAQAQLRIDLLLDEIEEIKIVRLSTKRYGPNTFASLLTLKAGGRVRISSVSNGSGRLLDFAAND